MGFMSKLFGYSMTGNWEETQRIELYKKLGKKIETMTPEQLDKIKNQL